MNIERAAAEFRPVIITLETQDEYDKLMAVLDCIAYNKVHWSEQVKIAAKQIRVELLKIEE